MGASNHDHRRPVSAGAGAAFAATLLTWWIAIGLIDDLTQKVSALNLQAATGLLAIIVLLVAMNWFATRAHGDEGKCESFVRAVRKLSVISIQSSESTRLPASRLTDN